MLRCLDSSGVPSCRSVRSSRTTAAAPRCTASACVCALVPVVRSSPRAVARAAASSPRNRLLSRAHRITSGDDYRLVVRRGARFSVPGVTVSVVERGTADAPTRFGFIISKRVGVAVVRNRLRRRLKHISLELLEEHPRGFDVVYRLQLESSTWSFSELREQSRKCVEGAVKKRSSSRAVTTPHRSAAS